MRDPTTTQQPPERERAEIEEAREMGKGIAQGMREAQTVAHALECGDCMRGVPDRRAVSQWRLAVQESWA